MQGSAQESMRGAEGLQELSEDGVRSILRTDLFHRMSLGIGLDDSSLGHPGG